MFSRKILFAVLALFMLVSSCSSSDSSAKTPAEKRAEELMERNPVEKGRYQCWRLSTAGDRVEPDLFILSDKLYEVNETVGKYRYDHERNAITILNGPLYQPVEGLTGFYLPKGSPTAGGGNTLESMIQFKKQSDIDSANARVILQCNCTGFN